MIYIYDMAGGTDYPGDALSSPRPAKPSVPEAPVGYHEPHAELRLAVIEVTEFPETRQRELVQGLDLSAMIGALDD